MYLLTDLYTYKEMRQTCDSVVRVLSFSNWKPYLHTSFNIAGSKHFS